MNKDLQRLNCMNYHVADSDNEYWFAQNGLRSLYTYSKIGNKSFREICNELSTKGECILRDMRDIDNDVLILTMI